MIQRRLLLIVLAAVTVALIALVICFNVILGHTLDRNASSLLRSRAEAQLEVIDTTGGKITLAHAPDAASADPGAWVFDGTRVVERPRARPVVDDQAVALSQVHVPTFRDVPEYDIRLFARPVNDSGKRIGSIVVAVSMTPYEQTKTTALVFSLVSGALILVLVLFVARWLLSSALRPVAEMTSQAATWSERDIDRRFGLGEPRDELTQLASTLDALLDRLASSLRHEQRFSAELSHELRTPLARVIAETELALRRERAPDEYRQSLEIVHANAVQLGRIVDALVAAAQNDATPMRGTADAFEVASGAASACVGLSEERGVDLDIVPPPRPLRVGVEQDFAERILQPVLENACRYGRSSVAVTIDRDDGVVRFSVADDGSGVAQDEVERIFEPGVRGRTANGHGSGLGLSLARRLASSVAGEIEALPDAGGGHFVVRLPAG
jgi:two-component system, OmpR family, sensor kinase